jgi:hypothetical protein
MGVAAALAPVLLGPDEARAKAADYARPLTFIMPRDHDPIPRGISTEAFAGRIGRAVLGYIDDAYGARKLPIWGEPAANINLHKRLNNIAYWAIVGAREHESIHPVDPVWVMAQTMSESFFHEFAISYAFAVGVCQFIDPTAKSYDMVTAGSRPEHAKPPYEHPELAGSYVKYREVRSELRDLRREHYQRFDKDKTAWLERALEAATTGARVDGAGEYLAYLRRAEELNAELERHRADFKRYLRANFAGRSIFDAEDIDFLRSFDERTTYRKPLPAMVHMLASGLKARGGYILAAASGFHAGLSNTRERGVYESYGCIPPFESTVSYISRVAINHHEIASRM